MGESLNLWAPGTGPSDEPLKDKNHMKINKVAVTNKIRATTAKA